MRRKRERKKKKDEFQHFLLEIFQRGQRKKKVSENRERTEYARKISRVGEKEAGKKMIFTYSLKNVFTLLIYFTQSLKNI